MYSVIVCWLLPCVSDRFTEKFQPGGKQRAKHGIFFFFFFTFFGQLSCKAQRRTSFEGKIKQRFQNGHNMGPSQINDVSH